MIISEYIKVFFKLDYKVGLAIGLFLSSASYAQENVINVYGLLVQKPCEILSSNTIDVDFGNISKQDILENNMPKRNFEIHLDSCPRFIQTKFIGPSAKNNQILTTDSNSEGFGVGVQLYNEDDAPLLIGQDYSHTHEGRESLHILKFKAQALKLDNIQRPEDIKPGRFSAIATYEISYD